MITVYGIKNCDTCRKALKWLTGKKIDHRFHDFRADGIDSARIGRWVAALGHEVVMNRRSTTWKQLSEKDREGLDDKKATALMAAHPTLIKRPVIEGKNTVTVGFTAQVQENLTKGP